MKRNLIGIVVLLLAVFMIGLPSMAKKKVPKSQLRSFSYLCGGGMNIESNDEASLWRHDDGKLTLTLRGTCPFEKVTFEVGEDVFLRCDSIIKATRLYESKGDYKSSMIVYDAPSTSFSVWYMDSKENFSGSGNMPREIRDGLHAVVDYLKSLRNGREAKGHLAMNRDLRSTEILKGTEWIDGNLVWKPEEDVEEMFRFLSQLNGIDYVPGDWELQLAEGSGQRCVILYNREQEIFNVMIDKATAGVKVEDTDDVPGLWPQTAQRVLTNSEIDKLPTDSLLMMGEEIYLRHQRLSSLRISEELRAQVKAQPWYKSGWSFPDPDFTDVEDQNFSLISMLIYRRNH